MAIIAHAHNFISMSIIKSYAYEDENIRFILTIVGVGEGKHITQQLGVISKKHCTSQQ